MSSKRKRDFMSTKTSKKRKVADTTVAARRGPSAEVKFIDFELIDATRGAGGAGELMNTGTNNNFLLIPEGNGPSTRNGRKITVTQFHVRFAIKRLNGTTPLNASEPIRVVFLVDTQCNGADPSIIAANSGILSNRNAAITDAMAFYNLFNGKRFKILYDKIFYPKSDGAGLAATETFSGSVFHGKFSKLWKKGLPIEYDQSATTGATSTIRTNNLLGFTITSGTDTFHYSMVARVRYTDS